MDAKLLVSREAIANVLNKPLCSTCTTLVIDVLQLRIALKIDRGKQSEAIFRELSESESRDVGELGLIQGCAQWERGTTIFGAVSPAPIIQTREDLLSLPGFIISTKVRSRLPQLLAANFAGF
jgi:hypothetical protein